MRPPGSAAAEPRDGSVFVKAGVRLIDRSGSFVAQRGSRSCSLRGCRRHADPRPLERGAALPRLVRTAPGSTGWRPAQPADAGRGADPQPLAMRPAWAGELEPARSTGWRRVRRGRPATAPDESDTLLSARIRRPGRREHVYPKRTPAATTSALTCDRSVPVCVTPLQRHLGGAPDARRRERSALPASHRADSLLPREHTPLFTSCRPCASGPRAHAAPCRRPSRACP